MKQINHGYADYYYLLRDGKLYNSAIGQTLKQSSRHTYIIRTLENKRQKVSLKKLYKLVFDKPYSKDNIVNLEDEQWKEIANTEGLYYISSKGRVKSLQGYETIILKAFANKAGYERVDIIEGGKRQTRLVHRLVAAAFLPMPQNIEMQLHHKDYNKLNNAVDNLEWLTPAEHFKKHAERSKKHVSTKSEENTNIAKK